MSEPSAAPPTDAPKHRGAQGAPVSTSVAPADPVTDDGQDRARLAQVRRERDAQLLDLGGLVFDLHRFGRRRDDLVIGKLDGLLATERRRREHEADLGEDRAPMRCPACTTSLLPGQEWCLECGTDVLTVAEQSAPFAEGSDADDPVGRPAPAEPQDVNGQQDANGQIDVAATARANGAVAPRPGQPTAAAPPTSGVADAGEADEVKDGPPATGLTPAMGPRPAAAAAAQPPRRYTPIAAPTAAKAPRRRPVPVAIAGGALALVAVLAAVIIFASGGSEDAADQGAQPATPAPVVSATGDAEAAVPSAPVTPPEPTGPAAWPTAATGFTVILVTTDEPGATKFARQLFDAGVTTTGVIAGKDYQDGPSGLFQTFAGRFDTQAKAQASAGRLAAKGYQGFVQEIKPPAATPASATTR